MQLEDKVAIVTGGAQGIGAAMVRALVDEGARVAIADMAIDAANALAAELGDRAMAVKVDVGNRASVRDMANTVAQAYGGIDILINNAAVFALDPIFDISEESMDRLFAVNVKGTLFAIQEVGAHMVKQGRGGKIINMASQAGRRGEALVGAYCASKAAVISLTQSAGLDLIKHRINVNAIAPGVVDTPMWDVVDASFAKHENLQLGEKKKQVGLAVPAGRMGTPDDFRGIAVFLASSASDYIVAQTYNVDGGNWMS
jgi:NAD(P)-dependent dehydrogenase (short-subunit alcohol dehydrogenase family)